MMKKSVWLVVIVVFLSGLSPEWMSRNTATAAVAPPEISRVSPSDTGETFQIFGEGLNNSDIYVWQPTGTKAAITASVDLLPSIADLPTVPPAAAKKVTPIKAYPQVLYAQAIYSGVAVVWLKNEAGYSKPWLMNAPEIWSQSSFEAMPGERVQLYGQNLYVSSISTKVKPVVYLRNNDTGIMYRASWGLANDQEMPAQNEKKFEFILPADIPAGAYQLWVHNGSGGTVGWSQPAGLTVLASRDLIGMQAMAWNRTGIQVDGQTIAVANRNVETVKAPNDGDLTDMTKELQKAIDKVAGKGGGIVMLEAGTYGITHTLELKPGVILRGVDKEATQITVAFGQKLAPFWPAITAYKGKPYTIFGNIVRGNAIVGNREAALFINQTYPYWLQKVPNPLNFDPSQTSGIEVNGGFNLVERNFVLGLPNGVRVRGDGEGNLIRNNRTDVPNQPIIDETGKAVYTPLAP